MKRILIIFTIISVLILPSKVKAHTYDNYVTINGTRMTGTNSVYSAGGSVYVAIVPSGSVDGKAPLYGFVALCSALGSDSSKYIYQYSSNMADEMQIINSTEGCAIPNTTYYRDSARIVYITFRLPFSAYSCGSQTCVLTGNVDLTFTQPGGSNVFSLISFGFGSEAFTFPNAINVQVNQNQQIINQQNTINNSINNVDNTINNDNVDSPNNALSSLNSYIATNSTISNLITLPITLFQKVLSSLNGTCSNYDLGEYKGTHIILPCINISDYIGTALFNVIDVLISGLLIYRMSRKFIAVFHNLSSMKDGDVISD